MLNETPLQSFIESIGTSLHIPGLTSAMFNADAKREWLRGIKGNIKDIYQRNKILYTYLEHHVNTKGQPMTLQGRPYLIQILMDESREMVVQKSVQCGLTEIALTRAYTSSCEGRSVLYTLPSHPVRNRFVANRVDRQLKVSPYYRAQVRAAVSAFGDKSSDARALKHIGLGVLHFVGSNTEGEFSEFPADELIIDEQDLCDPDNLGLAKDRLSESDYKRIMRISNPRKPGAPHSIGRAFESSTQNDWHVECDKCRHEQVLDWHGHFVLRGKGNTWRLRDKDGRPVCSKCKKPFDRLGNGRWVARYPDRKVSGYKISKLFTPSADIKEMFDAFLAALFNDTALQIFYGSELGEYYIPKSAGLTLDDLANVVDTDMDEWPEVPDGARVVMGVDVGAVLHYKASYIDKEGRRVAVDIGTASTFRELEDVADIFEPDLIVIDAHPEVHKVKEYADESSYDVFTCIFGSPEQVMPFKYDDNKDPPVITANRTAVMDGAFAAIKKGEVVLPKPAEVVDGFFRQMQTPTRQWDPDASKGRGRFIWTKGDGQDHYRLCDTYEWIAAQVLDESQVWGTILNT